jgi:hypothetical protein
VLRFSLGAAAAGQGDLLRAMLGTGTLRMTVMFWHLFRLLPFLHDLPGYLLLFNVADVPEPLLQLCSTPVPLARVALIYPLGVGVVLVAAALLVGRTWRSVAKLILGGGGLGLGAFVVGHLIGGYLALALLLGTCLAILIRGCSVVLTRPMGRVGRFLHAFSGAVVAVSAVAALCLLLSHLRQIYSRHLVDGMDGAIACSAASLLLLAGGMAFPTAFRRQDRTSRALARISYWLCVFTLFALPSYALARSSAVLHEVVERQIGESLRAEEPTPSQAIPGEAPHRKGKKQSHTLERALRAAPESGAPERGLESRWIIATVVLLGVRFIALSYIFFWLLGSALAELLYGLLPVQRAERVP